MNQDARVKIEQAQEILTALGLPVAKQTIVRRRRWALCLLALANVKPADSWSHATYWQGEGSWALRSRDVIKFWNEHYGQNLKDSSYDDVRDEDLSYLVLGGIALAAAGRPAAARNAPNRRFALSGDAHHVVVSYGTGSFPARAEQYVRTHGSLTERLERPRETRAVVARLPDGRELRFAQGGHNELQAAIVERFLPTFAPAFRLLYVGDAARRRLVCEENALRELGLERLMSSRLPDVIALDTERQWIFMVEAFESSGPIDAKRWIELEELAAECKFPRVYVTAFRTRDKFRQNAAKIAWETEVWIEGSPGHLVHFDGGRLLGPY